MAKATGRALDVGDTEELLDELAGLSGEESEVVQAAPSTRLRIPSRGSARPAGKERLPLDERLEEFNGGYNFRLDFDGTITPGWFGDRTAAAGSKDRKDIRLASGPGVRCRVSAVTGGFGLEVHDYGWWTWIEHDSETGSGVWQNMIGRRWFKKVRGGEEPTKVWKTVDGALSAALGWLVEQEAENEYMAAERGR